MRAVKDVVVRKSVLNSQLTNLTDNLIKKLSTEAITESEIESEKRCIDIVRARIEEHEWFLNLSR